MGQEPYTSANRVFGSSTIAPRTAVSALLIACGGNGPISFWFICPSTPAGSQIEIFFSVLDRKVLRPNTADSLFALEDAILAF